MSRLPAFPRGDGPMSDLRTSDLQVSNLQSRLRGLWLPLITPFRDGLLDETSLRRLVRHYIALPVNGLVLAATTGESLTLSPLETERLVFTVRDEAGRTKNLPVLLGLSGSNTSALLDTLARTASWPIDGYLISCPYYSRPSQRGLELHFQRARRSRQPSGGALQHSLPDRRQSRQRGDAAPRLASQYRRTEGLLRRPQPVARAVAPASAGLRAC